jgi:hypothetical protein
MDIDMESLFAISGLFILPFWALMILLPRWRRTLALVQSPVIVIGPVLLYAVAVLPALAAILPVVARPQLAPVAALLGQPRGATAAWMHFLAFDLFVARWIFLDARSRQLPARLISPTLLLTLLLGPLGLGVYLVVRGSALQRLGTATRSFVRAAAQGSRPLLALAIGSTALLAFTMLMQVVDHRLVLGVSTWLKPAKFAASVAPTALTLAWIIGQLGADQRRPGVRRAAWVIVATTTLELVIITVQAARGVPSHFNNRTVIDLGLFQVMGVAISVFWGAEVYLAWRTFRTRFADAALGWGIRLGLVAALLGGAQGFVMLPPTAAQLATLKPGQPTPLVGAHSIGAPDGGPGLPITHWNRQAGDLRVAHFLGLHGLQILPLLGWAVGQGLRRRRRPGAVGSTAPTATPEQAESARGPRLVVVASGGYIGLMLATFVQALQGHPLLPAAGSGGLAGFAADGLALAVGAACLVAFALLAWLQKSGPDDLAQARASDDQPRDPRVTVAAPHQA